MYICEDCFKEHQLESGSGLPHFSPCELCGPLKEDWKDVWVDWEAELTRPLGRPHPKQFILGQLEARKKMYSHESVASFGVSMSKKTAENMRSFLEGFRVALEYTEDPYKKGQHDAFDFMIKQIDLNLEREDA
jgi:hypothetical protein